MKREASLGGSLIEKAKAQKTCLAGGQQMEGARALEAEKFPFQYPAYGALLNLLPWPRFSPKLQRCRFLDISTLKTRDSSKLTGIGLFPALTQTRISTEFPACFI